MTWLPWVMLLFVTMVVMMVFFFKAHTPKAETSVATNVKYRYRRRKALCAVNEFSFLQQIDAAAGSSMRVFSKVHASHVLIPRSDLSIDNWNLSFEKVVPKHFDFVLCSATDLTILGAVMIVTEKSIKNPSYRFLLKACRSVGIPVINLDAQKEYSPGQIRYLLKKHIPDAFPRPQLEEVPSIIKEHQAKRKSNKRKPEDSLQTMLLQEGRRRASLIKDKKQVIAK